MNLYPNLRLDHPSFISGTRQPVTQLSAVHFAKIGSAVIIIAAMVFTIFATIAVTPGTVIAQEITRTQIPGTSSSETDAYKAFDTEGDPNAKIQLGESFEWRYPMSRYRRQVDTVLVTLYYDSSNW